jgi:hypothetical protein
MEHSVQLTAGVSSLQVNSVQFSTRMQPCKAPAGLQVVRVDGTTTVQECNLLKGVCSITSRASCKRPCKLCISGRCITRAQKRSPLATAVVHINFTVETRQRGFSSRSFLGTLRDEHVSFLELCVTNMKLAPCAGVVSLLTMSDFLSVLVLARSLYSWCTRTHQESDPYGSDETRASCWVMAKAALSHGAILGFVAPASPSRSSAGPPRQALRRHRARPCSMDFKRKCDTTVRWELIAI